MSDAVVDTDVVSFLFKSHPVAYQYLPDLAGRTLLVSFMTVAELDRWVLEARWGEARRKKLRQYLEPFAVLPYDRALCAKWVAATALLCGALLITHNRNDYLGVPGLSLISHGQ